VDRSSQTAIVERAKSLGRSLKYRYDGFAAHPQFASNDHQWILIHNWSATTFRTLHDVAVALDLIEAYDPPAKTGEHQ
jgi:hypothetical protein